MTSAGIHRFAIAAALVVARAAAAQSPAPAAPPEGVPEKPGAPEPAAPAEPAQPPPPLAQIKDEKQLTEILQTMTQDPAIAVDNPATRPLAQALMTEGVKQLQARAYDQALANFLEAYAKFPSPKILLNIASTLRDMGRLADAANTYQRYLTDPATSAERVAEVKELLLRLDDQLTILTVRVSPHGSDISIDGGPFIPVGSTLMTRVRSGLHLVRIRKNEQGDELTVNGFEGENKEVTPKVPAAAEPARAPTVAEQKPIDLKAVPAAPPERVDGWLITGTQYGSSDASGRERKVRSGSDGREITAIVPHVEVEHTGAIIGGDEAISSGVLGVVRIDGKGRGFAGGAGLAIAKGRFETELMVLKSDVIGGYLGFRFRLWKGVFRPYVAIGFPGFVYHHDEVDSETMMTTTTTRLAIGGRIA
ncbi:MAG TPA: tetratricopeptide repeat protein, partial [Kofleriaceae bacterium]|nr:tetratricopeptide repeat protein [Kofleriaceae bacterium]